MDVPPDADIFQSVITELEEEGWTDRQTRAVIVS